MCLYTNQFEAYIAEHPIKCYKTAYTSYYNNNPTFHSVYQSFCYRLNSSYKEIAFQSLSPTGEVKYGFHSYQSEKTAKIVANIACSDLNKAEVILECEIPKGARYFKEDDREFCSDSITVTGWKRRDANGKWDTNWRRLKQKKHREEHQNAKIGFLPLP